MSTTVTVILIVDEHAGRARGAHAAVCARLARDNYRVGQPVHIAEAYTGYLTFSARCPSWPANFLRRTHLRRHVIHAHACTRASMCPYDARARISKRARIYIYIYICRQGPGNCGNDDGSVRLESEMLPGARDACPNPLKLLGSRYPRGAEPLNVPASGALSLCEDTASEAMAYSHSFAPFRALQLLWQFKREIRNESFSIY